MPLFTLRAKERTNKQTKQRTNERTTKKTYATMPKGFRGNGYLKVFFSPQEGRLMNIRTHAAPSIALKQRKHRLTDSNWHYL